MVCLKGRWTSSATQNTKIHYVSTIYKEVARWQVSALFEEGDGHVQAYSTYRFIILVPRILY